MRHLGRLPLLLFVVVSAACGSNDSAELRASIDALLNTSPRASRQVWEDVRAFYAARDGQPAWVADRALTRTADGLRVLRGAASHGLDPTVYDAALAANIASLRGHRNQPDFVAQLADVDVRMTTALLTLARDVAFGRLSPEAIDKQWKNQRAPLDLAGSLVHAVDHDLGGWLDAVKPRHAEYEALRHALLALEREPVAEEAPGDAMSRADRIDVLKNNLERWRWLPDNLGARHLLVNIPSYVLTAREDGHTAMEIRVVVGKRGHETPVFSGDMATVVFSPYWHVPDSIVEGETAVLAAKDPEYLERNEIEIFKTSASSEPSLVDPSDVDWDDADALKTLAFRQKPGAGNALGQVKFLFPNPFSVYIHDTPADRLFERPERAFSHGCVRVEQPEVLANYVLQGESRWDAPRITKAMHSGVEQPVKLKSTIPVHIVYFTAWPDEDGRVHFYKDVYGFDRKQLDRLTGTTKLD